MEEVEWQVREKIGEERDRGGGGETKGGGRGVDGVCGGGDRGVGDKGDQRESAGKEWEGRDVGERKRVMGDWGEMKGAGWEEGTRGGGNRVGGQSCVRVKENNGGTWG